MTRIVSLKNTQLIVNK